MVSFLQQEGLPALAYHFYAGDNPALPTVMFCGGYRSDMEGSKALFLEAQCRARGQSYLRFDYRGHGQSGGEFEVCTIGDWLADAHAVFAALIKDGPVVIVGSSMGGWIGLLLALALEARGVVVQGFVGIAAAPDFTEEMFKTRLSPVQQRQLMAEGIVYVPNDYSDQPYAFTRAFYEEAKAHLLLSQPRKLRAPIKLLQGLADKDVP